MHGGSVGETLLPPQQTLLFVLVIVLYLSLGPTHLSSNPWNHWCLPLYSPQSPLALVLSHEPRSSQQVSPFLGSPTPDLHLDHSPNPHTILGLLLLLIHLETMGLSLLPQESLNPSLPVFKVLHNQTVTSLACFIAHSSPCHHE